MQTVVVAVVIVKKKKEEEMFNDFLEDCETSIETYIVQVHVSDM